MEEFKTDKAVYTANDFRLWQENSLLVLTPKFQRRPVWRTPAKSYFIDTLLRGMTVPPLYMRMTQDASKSKTIREVVDGQQRVRSVLDFLSNEFRLAKTLPGTWAGKRFRDLTPEEQGRITGFGFASEIFKGISDQQVLEVFCRLNMNGVPLNNQELRNGKYFGLFKQTAYTQALAYLEFWRKHKIFTEQSIARMLEVELTSELLIAGNSGMQDKKKSIDNFYAQWEDEYPKRSIDVKKFRETLETISTTFSGDWANELASSIFRRPPLFYTLYCVVFHHLFGLPGIQRSTPKAKLDADDRENLRDAAVRLSDLVSQSKDPNANIPRKYSGFITACQRQTDNITPRKVRFNGLFDEAF